MKAGISTISIAVSLALSGTVNADPNEFANGHYYEVHQSDANERNAIIGGDLLASFPPQTLLQGPIESVDVPSGKIIVLGQTFKAPANSKALTRIKSELEGGQTIIAAVVSRDIPGDYRRRGADLKILRESYVPGASTVFVAGKVRTANSSLASFRIGKLLVDYSSLLSTADVSISKGDHVVVAGTQTGAGLVLQAAALKHSLPDAIIGGDKDAIIGGDKDAIIGGDKDAIIGGDKDAIIGGDKDAIIGGDKDAIIGGDKDAIIGGDKDAIIGGDKDAIIGGDKDAIIRGDRNN